MCFLFEIVHGYTVRHELQRITAVHEYVSDYGGRYFGIFRRCHKEYRLQIGIELTVYLGHIALEFEIAYVAYASYYETYAVLATEVGREGVVVDRLHPVVARVHFAYYILAAFQRHESAFVDIFAQTYHHLVEQHEGLVDYQFVSESERVERPRVYGDSVIRRSHRMNRD